MVIERFKDGDSKAVGERFARCGRMLPDGVTYHASWVETNGTRCFQVMEAAAAESLQAWMSRWEDLITFEVVPILSSSDFWNSSEVRRG